MDRKKSNELVLKEANLELSRNKIIRQKQLQYLGHICRHKSLEHLAITGKIEDKRTKGVTEGHAGHLNNRRQETLLNPLRICHTRNHRDLGNELTVPLLVAHNDVLSFANVVCSGE
ncbi:hypothetical protein PoB_001111700 [Plakobranchus ocellatus]|uniref:Uncharacterized protein n=1 Tax=Plakobranchus ocellatus TaxID=259542 RepID=A0AAV3YQ75_9GAST|nr:hypothetical protein PoB_001111700 [Plakobranchus ocellatus]